MDGHQLMKTTPSTRAVTPTKPNSYDDQTFLDDFGTQSEESAKIEDIRVLPPKDFLLKMEASSLPYPNNVEYMQQKQSQNKQFSEEGSRRHYSTSISVGSPTKYLDTYSDAPLTGPLVFKVYPNGTPVHEPYKPHDEDLRQYRLSKIELPEF